MLRPSAKTVYKCNVCGNITEVLRTGEGELVCCGQPMELLQEKATDAGLEKHVTVPGILTIRPEPTTLLPRNG